jgi:hypothetical protein
LYFSQDQFLSDEHGMSSVKIFVPAAYG